MMGKISPIYILENAFSGSVISNSGDDLSVTISDIAVEKEQILVRFYTVDLPPEWKDKISDSQRIYGSYLPIAEIVLNDGEILTPSSASSYSFLEYNTRLIIGGRLVFKTNKTPQAFYLNFNQLPFDTNPLSEGFSHAVILSDSSGQDIKNPERIAALANDLEFTLNATAQTTELTMLQPAIRLLRDDEILSKFGWITIQNMDSAKRYAAERSGLYGFNLADDTEYSPAHAYTFAPLNNDAPISITMDSAYIVRTFNDPQIIQLDLNSKSDQVLLNEDNFLFYLTSAEEFPEEEKLRLHIRSENVPISDLSFKFSNLNGVIQPSSVCGMEPTSSQFACDIYFNENSFPSNSLILSVDAVEYRKDGPWTIEWKPAAMESISSSTDSHLNFESVNTYGKDYTYESKPVYPESLTDVMSQIDQKTLQLTSSPGWIHECFEYEYLLNNSSSEELITVDQFEQYLTHYLTDNWFYIGENGTIQQSLQIIRDSLSNDIRYALYESESSSTDLLHALRSQLPQKAPSVYSCFTDFSSIVNSSAIYQEGKTCEKNDNGYTCFVFYQTPGGNPTGSEKQVIEFLFDIENGMMISERIDYDSGELILLKRTIALNKSNELPEELHNLIDSVL